MNRNKKGGKMGGRLRGCAGFLIISGIIVLLVRCTGNVIVLRGGGELNGWAGLGLIIGGIFLIWAINDKGSIKP